VAADFNKGKVLSYKEGEQVVSGRLPFENSSSTAAAPSRAHAKGDAMGEGGVVGWQRQRLKKG